MLGLDLGITAPPPRLRPVAHIIAEFLRARYKGGVGPGFFDLFDFVAAGNRTYVNALGHVMTAGINAPRTGHHIYKDGAWVPVGLLLEPAGQNDIAWSEDFTNASWSGYWQKPTFTTGIASPDGGNNAMRWNAGATVGSGTLASGGLSYDTGIAAGVTLTASVWLRASAPITLRLGVDDSSQSDAAVTTEWTRFSVAAVTDGSGRVFQLYDSTNPGIDIDIFGAQSEQSPVATSYIKTEGTPLARAKDSLEISASVLAAAILAATGSSAMPAAISIAVEGHMSYADTDQAEEVTFVDWKASNLHYIRAYLDTAGNNTGQAIFIQREAASGVDVAFSVPNAYAPGVNVPFSVASYHTAESINGAHDGTVLTANLTPTALADLTLAPIQIAPKGIMTVKALQMFLGVCGDDLLGELTQ